MNLDRRCGHFHRRCGHLNGRQRCLNRRRAYLDRRHRDINWGQRYLDRRCCRGEFNRCSRHSAAVDDRAHWNRATTCGATATRACPTSTAAGSTTATATTCGACSTSASGPTCSNTGVTTTDCRGGDRSLAAADHRCCRRWHCRGAVDDRGRRDCSLASGRGDSSGIHERACGRTDRPDIRGRRMDHLSAG